MLQKIQITFFSHEIRIRKKKKVLIYLPSFQSELKQQQITCISSFETNIFEFRILNLIKKT